MTSHETTSGHQWRVKIMGLGQYVTVIQLSNQFEVEPQQISIHKSQTHSSKLYALINGFKSEEQAIIFLSKWNDIFTDTEINISYELDTDTNESSPKKNSDSNRSQFTSSNRSTYNHESDDDDDASNSPYGIRTNRALIYATNSMLTDRTRDSYQQDRDDSYSSQSKTHSKHTQCRHGDSCYTADCPYRHSPEWRACKKGAQCKDYACSANHPRNRKAKCKHGSECWTASCSYLHPNTNKSESSYDDDNDQSYSHVQLNEDDFDEVGYNHKYLL
ncbi:unnamed protein product [Rotaria sordida]|uniref:Uncharacterized protein n=1 Tax=Rotaria sordida TaxID=392033 RepID=A0A819E4Q8_9BILA|nr:unnamed protein product [Rotaria sordida]CAF4068783.1 unnamed protein product [Rotaria sordida]